MTEAQTVREALAEAEVGLGPLDEVEPPIWSEIDRSVTVEVIRGREEVEERELPFSRETVKDEALAEGESRLAQLGVNGRERVTYLVKTLQGEEISREVLEVEVLKEPQNEVIVIGARGDLPPIPIRGTIAYISNGNAWIMRGTSTEKRPLTFEGDLDKRVFSLSPDGTSLLFTRDEKGDASSLNTLWEVNTVLVGAKPRSLGIQDAIYGEWSPDGTRFAYSTAEGTSSLPGWKANNDLWISSADGVTRTLVLEPSSEGAYSWWGTNFAWNPDGAHLAYSTPDSVGLVDVAKGVKRPLLKFPEHHTYENWVWVPSPSWAPDGRFLVSVVHGSLSGTQSPEDSPLFDLWVAGVDGRFAIKLVDQVGMWSYPKWSKVLEASDGSPMSQIAYGVAQSDRHTEDSAYDIYLMDRDGSNRIKLYPPEGGYGLTDPETVWSPRGDSLLFKRGGDLYMLDVEGREVVQLTNDGQSGQPQWKGS
jgi:Tol biopolymer transport system component